ncbi:E3 ubiquitin-protein ligase SMURF2-like [Sarcoptes scabiei]|nr:E3 ubiquitin-protein ligase SMURF2-like [Sarcoptes scabiei]
MSEENLCDISQSIDNLSNDINLETNSFQKFTMSLINSESIEIFNLFVEKFLLIENECLKRDKLLDILNEIIFDGAHLENLIQNAITGNFESPKSLIKFINILVSMPELISNLYGMQYPLQFGIQNYIERLCLQLKQTIKHTHQRYQSDLEKLSWDILGAIVQRLSMKGYAEMIWVNLFDELFHSSSGDSRLIEIMRKILLNDHKTSLHLFNLDCNQSKSLEPIFKMIFHNAPQPKVIKEIFCFNSSEITESLKLKIKYLLTSKFILSNYHQPIDHLRRPNQNPDRFIFNLMGFLYLFDDSKWFKEACINLCEMWSNSSAFNYRSFNQQYYLCRMIIIAAKLLFEEKLNRRNDSELIETFKQCAFTGATINLSCSQPEFRLIGHTTSLILFKLLVKYHSIQIEMPKFDEFDRSDLDDYRDYLNHLGSLPVSNIFDSKYNCDDRDYLDSTIKEGVLEKDPKVSFENNDENDRPSSLDSEDDEEEDLKPYDLSNDISIDDDVRLIERNFIDSNLSRKTIEENIQSYLLVDNSKRRPIYLQDCIEGLCEREKPDWMERCLRASEKIIRSNFESNLDSSSTSIKLNRLDSSALRFTEILFHLDDCASIDQFDQLRLNSLIALCVGSPKIVSNYLTEQFYAQYIPIRNRLDVLAVLTMASQELCRSKPITFGFEDEIKLIEPKISCDLLSKISEKNRKFRREYFMNSDDSDDGADESRKKTNEISKQNKIESQTRYFRPSSKLKQEKDPEIYRNRFIPFAKHFFFPLLQNSERLNLILRIDEEDSFVLENLIYALGVLLGNCAQHQQSLLMSKELLSFLDSFLGHKKSNVRSAIVHTFVVILESTPKHFLMNDLLEQMITFKQWLQGIIINDLDQKCIRNAYLALKLLHKFVNDTGMRQDSNEITPLMNETEKIFKIV